ncbi:MAG TPA: class II fructose-bisphosphatase [Ktedonobacterales bacterium]
MAVTGRFVTKNAAERNLALELVRVTEAAAYAAANHMGRGDKIAVDQAAVDAMRSALDGVDMQGVVVIGEGEKDEAPMLYVGEEVGNGQPPLVDVAVDPVDGTRLTSLGLPGAIAVVATADRGTMYQAPPGVYYMSKLAVPPAAAKIVDLDAPVAHNLNHVARALDRRVQDLTVIVLDRPRHSEIITAVRETGARIRLITDGDVAAAIQAARQDYDTAHVYIGTGGAPEAVLAAAAIKCVGGELLCKVWPRTEHEREKLKADGVDLDHIFSVDTLITSDNVSFAATGITPGELLRGVEYIPDGARTHSLMMRSKTGTVRLIDAYHHFKVARESL